jgi:hypothetical protein
MGFVFLSDPHFQPKNVENWLCLAQFVARALSLVSRESSPGPIPSGLQPPASRPLNLALIGFAFDAGWWGSFLLSPCYEIA